MNFSQFLPWLYAAGPVLGAGMLGVLLLLIAMGMPELPEAPPDDPPAPEMPAIPPKVRPKFQVTVKDRLAMAQRRAHAREVSAFDQAGPR